MHTPAQSPRVFLADDHVLLREGLKAVLQQRGFEVVGEASNGLAAVKLCESLRPDVAILDIGMPLLNGIDAAKELVKLCPESKIILLTMYPEDSYVLASLRAGVRGYILKSNASANLVQAIESVMKGETYLSSEVANAVVDAYLSASSVPDDPLSPREREVLQLIAEGKNVKEIGGLLGISSRTVETHRTRLMQKLNIHEVAGLVRYAIAHRLINVYVRPPS
ncbi:MAG TPA: response regulator transcription factor [Candidatus Nanoarchaeia archaeon]|nr:response regulator transcription factor [Candidatus Nanoarchaeia archaeon]